MTTRSVFNVRVNTYTCFPTWQRYLGVKMFISFRNARMPIMYMCINSTGSEIIHSRCIYLHTYIFLTFCLWLRRRLCARRPFTFQPLRRALRCIPTAPIRAQTLAYTHVSRILLHPRYCCCSSVCVVVATHHREVFGVKPSQQILSVYIVRII